MFHWFWGGLNYPVLYVLEVDAATEEQVVKVEKTIRDSDSFVWGGCLGVIHIPSMYGNVWYIYLHEWLIFMVNVL